MAQQKVVAGFVIIASLLSKYMGGNSVGGWNDLVRRVDDAGPRAALPMQ